MICTNISIFLTVLEEGLINRNISREVFKLLEEEIPVVIFSYPKYIICGWMTASVLSLIDGSRSGISLILGASI